VTTLRLERAIAGWARPARLTVALSERSYEVVVGSGLLARAGGLVTPHLPSISHGARRAVVVSDASVAALHGAALRKGCWRRASRSAPRSRLPPGEGSKSLARLEAVLEAMLAPGPTADGVVALGGGVVGDLAGFAAAVALRGLPFVQVPTTLLAQVDSSVGGRRGEPLGRQEPRGRLPSSRGSCWRTPTRC
jgi:shikimate kinase/3-dehydroquinate synthase